MTSVSKQRAAASCIFCGRKGVTGEHLFSQWMHKKAGSVLPDSPLENPLQHTFGGSGIDPRSGTQISYGRAIESGRLRSRRFFVVCGDHCNGGWMSRLDARVKPFLEPLIGGASVVLNAEQRATLAQWAVMKSVVLAASEPADLMILDQVQREAIMNGEPLPHNVRVYLIPNPTVTVTHAEFFRRHFESPFPPGEGEPFPAHLFQATMLFGKIVIGVAISHPSVPMIESYGGVPEWFMERLLWPILPGDDSTEYWPRGGVLARGRLEWFAASSRSLGEWLDMTMQSIEVGMHASVDRIRAGGGSVEISGPAPRYFQFVDFALWPDSKLIATWQALGGEEGHPQAEAVVAAMAEREIDF